MVIDGIKVSGRVLSSDDQEGLPGVNVLVKGTLLGTVTDVNGNYSIDVPGSESILVFSSVGYIKEEVTVGNSTVVDITLMPDITALEEIVVIGYGEVRKSDLTGSVASVDIEDMNKMTKTSLDQSLQGMAAGVLVTQNSAQPGGGTSIRIRGTTSLTGGNEPLYVIDGIPIEVASNGSGANFGPALNPMSLLNPDDIQNIEILKDASSTAIYGARGSNGVVLITTKQGTTNDTKVTFSASYGIQDVATNLEVLNAPQFMEVVNQALLNDNNGDESIASSQELWYTQDEKDSIGQGVDWLDQVLTTGNVQNYQVSVTGGKDKLRYYLSIGHNINNGIVKNSNFQRTSIRLNLNSQATKRLGIGGNLTVSDVGSSFIRTEGDRQNAGVSSVMYSALRYRPTKPIFLSEEDDEFAVDQEVSNPLALVEKVTNTTNRLAVIGNLYGEYQILEGLKFKTTGAFNYNSSRDNFYAPQEGTYLGAINGGIGRVGFFNRSNLTNTNALNYNKTIGNHRINAVGVFEIIYDELYRVLDEGAGFVNDNLREHDLSSASNASKPRNYTEEWGLVSYLARINYSYADKYLFSASGRYDGSSRFGENNKYAFFPSASAGWVVSNEAFMENLDFLSQLKIRVSYGVVGNQSIPLYSSTSPFASDAYVLNNSLVTGFHSSRIANPDLRWEQKVQTNFGIDFSFLEGRISGTTEYYKDVTKDLLLAKRVPISSGYSNVISNIGSIENSGFEFSLNTVNINRQFSWRTSFNISFPKTLVKSLGEDQFLLAGYTDFIIKNSQIVQVGEPLGQFYGYINEGIAQTADDVPYTLGNTFIGDYKFRDISGPEGVPDGLISQEFDKVVIGNANPDFFGGITNSMSYKNLEFSFFFQGTFGNDIMNVNKAFIESSKPNSNLLVSALDAWTPTNTDAEVRMLSFKNVDVDANTRYVEDGSYLRLKNVTLAYNLPGEITSRLGLTNVQLSLSGQNLLTFTKYSGMDPEVDAFRNNSLSFGHDVFGYPQSRIISGGFSVTF
ncbi:MAG: TonB-dependent receptor [Cyclobacteriaceae bacterium]|nr:TonB-dependent receptor [Cyclobacteriaceae bacterium]